MANLIFNRAKMNEIGGGNIKGFCEITNIKRGNLYRIENSTRTNDGTYAQEIAERLVKMGCAEWVNKTENDTKEILR